MSVSRKAILLGAAIAMIAALFWLLAHVDPAEAAWFPKCPVKLLTGWECPGCGSSRALHALLHGRVGEALGHNPILVLALPDLLMLSWLEYGGGKRRHPRLHHAMTSRAALWIIVGVLAGWTLVRNLL